MERLVLVAMPIKDKGHNFILGVANTFGLNLNIESEGLMYSYKQIKGNVPCYKDHDGDYYGCEDGSGHIKDSRVVHGMSKLSKYNIYIIGDSMTVHQYMAGAEVRELAIGDHCIKYPARGVVRPLCANEVCKNIKKTSCLSFFHAAIKNRALEILAESEGLR